MDSNNYYQQPQQQIVYVQKQQETEPVVGIGDWMLTGLIMSIPVVSFVMMFVYAFGSKSKSKQNLFRAALLWSIIWGVLITILMIILAVTGVLGTMLMSSSSYLN